MYAVSRLAVQRLRKLGHPAERILDFASLMDQTCVRVCEGQFLDISFESRTDVTADRYRVMAARKTGALFAASAQSAAVLASDDASVREQLAHFGEEFGQAFQAYDDLLGIWASTERTGKIEMNDLVKRKKTLPVVLAFERASPRVRAQLDELFTPQAPLPAENVDRIRATLDDLGVRPMLERGNCVLEAHVFGEPGSLYGELVEVRFMKFLRDEQRFESFEALAAQMQEDGAQARAALGKA